MKEMASELTVLQCLHRHQSSGFNYGARLQSLSLASKLAAAPTSCSHMYYTVSLTILFQMTS